MSSIGKIRIKSFGKLLPPNSLSISDEKLDICPETSPINNQLCSNNYDIPNEVSDDTKNIEISNENFNDILKTCVEKSSLSPTIKIEIESTSVDCVDLTEDTFETPLKKKLPNEMGIKKSQLKKLTTSKVKNNTKQPAKQKPIEDSSQTNLLSFFTPGLSVKKAPKKLGKPPEKTEVTSSVSENTPPRKLRKLSLRRNILNDVPCGSKKKEITKSKTKNMPKSKSEKKSKHLMELENVAEPTVIPGVIDLCQDSESDEDIKNQIKSPLAHPKRPLTVKSEKSICPSYKVIEGTTFAVDGFKFGRIEGVTAYFLSHFHSDHYIGLTRKFSMPLYVSQITANLMREFIPIDEKFINILSLNITTIIEGVQVTAIDANHCPGAVMFLFQLPCGKRILHTGDFRASIEMESDYHLSQRNIDLLYLDTTYISNKYSFQTQEKSIADALKHVREFRERNEGKRILFVVGAYLVGKEKFWLPIAKEFDFKIWTDSNRRKIMHAIDDEEILQRLVTKSRDADMHIISMMKVGYRGIEAYWEDHSDAYDMIFAIRPSGWEKNSKPQFRGQLNIIGIEYSEHSSHNELRRFLSFLKPQEVISTVPYGKDLTLCSDVPLSWYKKECFSPIKKQASMLDYFSCSKIDNKNS
ncbi:DNA cross-link repair 1A protein isoform X2 [Episyrphus balteatus]|uniref:DNA cross-link repair 1A protein isoform X2 n=1 Tax=Episyrphus balteatus TaxID=286459 RepID=UPI0024857291|nr:DNA cross-link repair 1A protein isoform X2 [Episyrphus balteatus]